MVEIEFKNKIKTAAKWSVFAEIAAKVMNPLTNVILARILLPEVFGVVATVTMITSFIDLFTNAGFQKYLVQQEFLDDAEKYKHANVAFWANLGISAVLLGSIVLARDQIAVLVGSPGLGNVIAIASIQLVITSFSSIQLALYRREFDFKTLFWVRIVAISVPFIVTIPLAFSGFGYWSIIIGTLCIQLSSTVILTVKSKWKPRAFFSLQLLKRMLSFGIWSTLETMAIWLTIWVDVFIVANYFNQYFIGLYKTSITMVDGLMSVIVASTITVLFSALSRLKDDETQFKKVFFKTQRLVSVLVFPLGALIFVFGDVATRTVLGSQWAEAGGIISIYALLSPLLILFGYFSTEVYRSRGRLRLSFFTQTLYLAALIPVCLISVRFGFWPFVYARIFTILEMVAVNLIVMRTVMKIPAGVTIKNVLPAMCSAGIAASLGWFLRAQGQLNTVAAAAVCTALYIGVLSLFKRNREELVSFLKKNKTKKAFRQNLAATSFKNSKTG